MLHLDLKKGGLLALHKLAGRGGGYYTCRAGGRLLHLQGGGEVIALAGK